MYVILRGPGNVRDHFQDISLHVVSMFLWVQDLLPGLEKRGQAICGNCFGILSERCRNGSQLTSSYEVGNTIAIRVYHANFITIRMAYTCP